MCTKFLAAMIITFAASSAIAQNLVSNPGFESPAILGPGQSPPTASQYKPIVVNPAHPLYHDAISGVPNWSIDFSTPLVGVDAGLGRDYLTTGQFAFINNWDRSFHQTLPDVLTANTSYTVGLDALFPDVFKAGKLKLIAGSYVGNVLSPGSTVLQEISFGTPDWNPFVPDVVFGQNVWTQIGFTYHSPAGGPVVGMPLVFSFETVGGSAGPVYFDNASVVVPEPTGALLCVMGVCWASRRRR